MQSAKGITSSEALLKHSADGRLEAFKLIREYIVHEDNLVSQRMTWFLTLNSFLFASVALLTNATISADGPYSARDLYLFALLLSFVGFVSCGKTKKSVRAAYDAIKALKDHWIVHFEPNHLNMDLANGHTADQSRIDISRPFPYIAGGGPYQKVMARGRTSPHSLINWMGFVWLAIAVHSVWKLVSKSGLL